MWTISKEHLVGVAIATLTDEKMALVDEVVRLHLNLWGRRVTDTALDNDSHCRSSASLVSTR